MSPLTGPPVNNSIPTRRPDTTKIINSPFTFFTPAKIPIQSATKVVDEVLCEKGPPQKGTSP